MINNIVYLVVEVDIKTSERMEAVSSIQVFLKKFTQHNDYKLYKNFFLKNQREMNNFKQNKCVGGMEYAN